MMLDQAEVTTAEIYLGDLRGVTFKACGFEHDFRRPDGSYRPFCVDRNRNLGCAHIADQEIKSTIKFLAKHQIFTEKEAKIVLEGLAMVNLDIVALDTWTQELDELQRNILGLPRLVATSQLEKQQLPPAKYLDAPELLRAAPRDEQIIVVQPKIYLKVQLENILACFPERDFEKVRQIATGLVAKFTAWIEQDDSAPLVFDWSV